MLSAEILLSKFFWVCWQNHSKMYGMLLAGVNLTV